MVELIVPTRLAPIDTLAISSSAADTGRLLVVEEGTLTLGWGAEILARVAEHPDSTAVQVHRVAAREHPIPAANGLEAATLPGVDDIVQAAISLIM